MTWDIHFEGTAVEVRLVSWSRGAPTIFS